MIFQSQIDLHTNLVTISLLRVAKGEVNWMPEALYLQVYPKIDSNMESFEIKLVQYF